MDAQAEKKDRLNKYFNDKLCSKHPLNTNEPAQFARIEDQVH